MEFIKKGFVQFLALLIVVSTINLQPGVLVFADDTELTCDDSSPTEACGNEGNGDDNNGNEDNNNPTPNIPNTPGDTEQPDDTNENEDEPYNDVIDTPQPIVVPPSETITPPIIPEVFWHNNLPVYYNGPGSINIIFSEDSVQLSRMDNYEITRESIMALIRYLDSISVKGDPQTITFTVQQKANSHFGFEIRQELLDELKRSYPNLTLNFSAGSTRTARIAIRQTIPSPPSRKNENTSAAISMNDLAPEIGFIPNTFDETRADVFSLGTSIVDGDSNVQLPALPFSEVTIRTRIPVGANLNDLAVRRYDDTLKEWIPVNVINDLLPNRLSSNNQVSLAFDDSSTNDPSTNDESQYIEFTTSQSGKFMTAPMHYPSFKDISALSEKEKYLIKRGIIKGSTDGKLNRTDDLKYTDFIVMILRSLGLEQGSADGFDPLQLALDYGLIDKKPTNPNAAITIGESVAIYNNALRYDALQAIGSEENLAKANGIKAYSVATTEAISPTAIKSNQSFIATNSISGIGNISGINLQSIDLETALQAVQSQRASLLEDQLKTQLNDVSARNNRISELNEALGNMRGLSGSLGDDANAKINEEDKDKYESIASKYGIDTSTITNKGELDKAIENVKSLIDGESNSQQMDMLRLQSLSNKRNEAFDLMTNFVKKMQENRSSIISNMR